MAVVPVNQIPSGGVPLDVLTNILMDLAAATGIFQSVKGEIKGHQAAKVYSELEKLARILMDDTSRANEIIRAAQNNRDDIVQSLVGSSPVGSRIQILKRELAKNQKIIKDNQKKVDANSTASENISSYQRSADEAAQMYGKSQDFWDAKALTKKSLSTPDQIRKEFEKPNYNPSNATTLIKEN